MPSTNRSLAVTLSLAAMLALAGPIVIGSPLASAQQDGSSNSKDNSKGAKQRDAAKDAAKDAKAEKEAAKAKARWFERLDNEDRAAVEAAVGYAAPEIPEKAERLNVNFKDLAELRGKVVVLQTFTSKVVGGFVTVEKTKAAIDAAKVPADDVVFVAIHTPEAADKAKAAIDKRKLTAPVVIDSDGAMCDALGAYRRGVALVIDRQGNIRYGGLSEEGVTNAVKELAAIPFDASVAATKRSDKPVAVAGTFPEFKDPVSSAADMRGKALPGIPTAKWWNFEPKTANRLLVVDFWATWCGPCRAAIPHMNDIAKAYPNDVACMGISDESNRNFDEGVVKHGISKSDFAYSVGNDGTAGAKNFFRITGIPHVAIISSDGIVRWQGHPMSLTPEVMNKLVAANKSLLSAGNGPAGAANRWSKTRR